MRLRAHGVVQEAAPGSVGTRREIMDEKAKQRAPEDPAAAHPRPPRLTLLSHGSG
jgi:hypothetical protein